MLCILNLSRLMLRLELTLLGMTAFTTISLGLIDISPQFPTTAIVCIVALGLMGLKLPRNQLFYQIIYILVEFGLVWLPILSGDRIPTFPLLIAVIVIRSREMFNKPTSLIMTGSIILLSTWIAFILREDSFVGFLGRVVQSPQPHDIEYTTRNILILKLCTFIYFVMMSAFFFMLINSLLAEHQSRKDLSVALEQIRLYALQIEDKATLEERNRIAREIHDALGHTLSAQSIQLDSGLLLLDSAQFEEANSFFKTAKALCTQALQEVRQSVTTLRGDSSLLKQTLETSIQTLIKNLQTTTNIIPNCTLKILEPISEEISSAVYRIVQEALTNITRHSTATEVTIELVTHEHTLYVLIKDNGKGFNPEENSTGFGIQGMRERTMILNGQFSLVSQPGAGCLITIQIPLLRLS